MPSALWRYKFLSDQEAAWLASALDFEGSLSLTKSKLANNKGLSWMPTFQLGVTNQELAEKVKEIIGAGSLCYSKPRKDNHHGVWHYSLKSVGLRMILPQIKPFVVAKKRQVELMMRALDLVKGNRGIGHYGNNNARLETIKMEIERLNKEM